MCKNYEYVILHTYDSTEYIVDCGSLRTCLKCNKYENIEHVRLKNSRRKMNTCAFKKLYM